MLNSLTKLIIAIGISLSAGLIGSVFTSAAIPDWYAGLDKPFLSPPNWIFAPVWTILYILIGVAAFFVWQKGLQNREVRVALTIFLGQLILNTSWSIVFFGLRSPFWALINILVLVGAIVWMINSFYKISHRASYLLVPYLLWVLFASYLNFSIWLLN